MQIQFNPIFFKGNQEKKSEKKAYYPNLAPLKHDTVSFGAFKKFQLQGFDLACAKMFKVSLGKFNSTDDFHNWSREELDKTMDLEKYKGANDIATDEIRKSLKTWKDYLNSDDYYKSNPALSLIIFSSVLKDISPDSEKLPPILHQGVLADTVENLNDLLKGNNKATFDFNKMYQNNLRLEYAKEAQTVENDDPNAPKEGKWVKIPSKAHDPENFEENVKKLKALSCKTWCTRSAHAGVYLGEGDFHIYLENNKSKIGLRFDGEKLVEIQGEKNNRKVPLNYLDEVKSYIDKNKFEGCEDQIKDAFKARKELEELKIKLKDAIANKDYPTILSHFGIKCKTLDNGNLELSHYKQPSEEYGFADLGIDENDLFKKVEKITGNANFENSQVADLGNLTTIGDYAEFGRSKITDLGKLTTIGGVADFVNSKITDLGNLTSIGGHIYFVNSKITDLGKLTTIGGNAYFNKDTKLDYSKIDIKGKVILV